MHVRCRRPGFHPWVGKFPQRRAWQATPLFLPGESHGQRSLAGLQSMGSRGVRWDWVTSTFTSHLLSSVQFSRSVISYSWWYHGQQHTRLPCPSSTTRDCSNPHPLSRWCHLTILSSVDPFSSRPQSFPASGTFPMSQLFTSGGQSTGVSASASVLPMSTQDWSPLGWTGWISLQSKGLSRVFSNTTVQKHQFFVAQLSSQSNSPIHTWPLQWFCSPR